MPGKRKREDSLPDQDECSTPLPLTEANLNTHNTMNPSDQGTQADKRDPADQKTWVSLTSDEVLNAHNIYVDRRCTMPPDVQDLRNRVLKLRDRVDGHVTPTSQRVTKVSTIAERNDELTAQKMLENGLGYRGEYEFVEGPGTKGIDRGFNRLWRPMSVPRRTVPISQSRTTSSASGEEDAEMTQEQKDEVLRRHLEKAGVPPTPKPDITYGYTEKAVGFNRLRTLQLMPGGALVLQSEPLLPYWTVQWKSNPPDGTGSMKEATMQVRRDGASAVNAMSNFYRELDVENPSPARTAVFSMCVDSQVAKLRIHWFNAEDSAFEADPVCSAILEEPLQIYDLRSVILNILEWASGDRLTDIRSHLDRRGHRVNIKEQAKSPRKPRSSQKTATQSSNSEQTSQLLPASGQPQTISPPASSNNFTGENRGKKRKK